MPKSLIIGSIGAMVGIASGWVLANVVAIAFRERGGAFRGNQAVTTDGGMMITPLLTTTVTILASVFGVGVAAVFRLIQLGKRQNLNQ